MGMTLLIVVGVVVLLVALMYNSLIGKRNRVDSVFATTDVLLKKRYDLIPNLVSAVQGYMEHERGTLQQITELRKRALGSQTGDEKVAVDNQIAAPLRQILVAVENYPELKASANFLQLQGSLNEVEEQISAARRAFNAAVLDYNNAVDMFPTNVMARMSGFTARTFFATAAAEREVPRVAFSEGSKR